MTRYKGKGVYGAAAIGRIRLLGRQDIRVKRQRVEDISAELERLAQAREQAVSQLKEIYEKALVEVGEANAQIFEIHTMMVEAEEYNEAIEGMIRSQRINAEYAVAMTSDNFAEMFGAMEDSYMQARAADVHDIGNRIIACLTGQQQELSDSDQPVIICADDLAPSVTVSLDKSKVLAVVTAHGSANSHTAILARSMNIPAIIGLGEEFLGSVRNGDMAIADGFSGELILSPDDITLSEYRRKIRSDAEKTELLHRLKGKVNETIDGTRIKIYANIGGVDEVGAALMNDAGGIGLFRSEFMYLESSDYPTEEQQLSIYKRVLESMGGRQVIIRTLDIGADKQAEYFRLEREENPALGLRAIRLCLARPELFRTQLRALYRASVYGRLGIMFPMIASEWELREILSLCDEIKQELSAAGMEFSENVQLGIMIETPAAAVISDRLAPLADFFSVGTNDLTQYTLACDRQNPRLERHCDPHHEAVMRLIKYAADSAHKHGKWIGICGELAADTRLTEQFLRMGIDELSVAPGFVLKLREAVRSIDLRK